jgi:hypothetical protein
MSYLTKAAFLTTTATPTTTDFISGHHLQHAQQMAMSLGGLGGPLQGSSSGETQSSPGSILSKRERKRKSDSKANLAAVSAAVNAAGHSMTRDERKAMALGLPITVQVSIFLIFVEKLNHYFELIAHAQDRSNRTM